MPERVRWSSEKPSESGYWWIKDGTAALVVRVEIGLEDSYHVEYVEWPGVQRRTRLDLIEKHCYWAGPLTPPEEAPDEA